MLRKIRKTNSAIKNFFNTIRLYWQPIFLENPWASFAAFFAIPIAFIADSLSTQSSLFTLPIRGREFGISSYLVAFFIVLIIYLIGVLSETKKFIFYNRTSINLPIVINIGNKVNSSDVLNIFIQSLTEKLNVNPKYLHELERYLTIASEDLVFQHSLDINKTEELHDVFAVIRHNLTRLQSQTPKEHTLEIAYVGPVAISIWLGAVTKTEAIALWPYDRGTTLSYPERIEVPNNIQVFPTAQSVRKTECEIICEGQFDTQVWLVALDLAGERRFSPQQLKSQGFDNYLYIYGTEPIVNIASHEYFQYAQEVYNHISALNREYFPTSIRLITCVPNVLAIILGRMLGTMLPVEVTHYNRESGMYSVLFKLNDPRFRYQHIA